MSLRLSRYRLKTEWLRLLLGLMFAVILFSWYGAQNIVSDVFHSKQTFAPMYNEESREWMASRLSMEIPEEAWTDLSTAYRTVLRAYRGFLYSRLVMSINDPVDMLVVNALAVLLLTSLFQKKRLGPPLAAGYCRRRLFLSLTGVYFACVVVVWCISATYLLNRYCIEFAPEEREFFLVTQLTWFCTFLWNASIAYLASMLLRRPLPAFLAGVAVYFLCLSVGKPHILPGIIIGGGMTVKTWDPGVDLWPLLRTDIIAAAFFVVAVVVGWFSFRKRGME